MKAAANFQRPPSAFLGGREWGSRDHLLVFAFQLYEDNKCSSCGRSVLVCRNEDNKGVWEAEATICTAQAAIQERQSQSGYTPEPGEMLYSRPIDDDLLTGSGIIWIPARG